MPVNGHPTSARKRNLTDTLHKKLFRRTQSDLLWSEKRWNYIDMALAIIVWPKLPVHSMRKCSSGDNRVTRVR
ncbi:hypothetical protein VNI00_016929 [Paramarasmius palmivorus]|uniref:Transposase n=1 Tax=Paramarasmius palmivorus TaxID=297713 RepID=A0AAW0B9N1_9AGAR